MTFEVSIVMSPHSIVKQSEILNIIEDRGGQLSLRIYSILLAG